MEIKAENQEFGIKDLVQSFKNYGSEIRKKIWLFVGLFILISGFLVYRWAVDQPQYISKINFMLNDSEGSSMGFNSILGQIGLPTTSQRLNLQKILEIAKTRKIGEKLYFKKIEINGKDDLLGNHLIDVLAQEGKWFNGSFWNRNDSMNAFRFFGKGLDTSNIQYRLALKILHTEILKRVSTHLNEKTGIMEIAFLISNEDLAIQYIHLLYAELSEFYINKSIEKQEVTFQKLQNKVDSLRSVIFRKDYSLADVKDSYRNTYLNQDVVPATQIDRDIKMLSIIYGEALKNMELASFNLQNKMPFIQVLDMPVSPLDTKKQSLPKNLLTALLISFFMGLVILIFQKVIREN